MRLLKCGAIGAGEGEDMTESGRDVELADSGAWAKEVWAVVHRHSGQSWAAGLHDHETFPARLLRHS